MKLIKVLPVFVLLVVLNGCFETPDFPIVPQIEFDNIRFIELPGFGDPDTLKLTIKFKDGDGDLGFDPTNPEDNAGDYRERFYYIDNNGDLIVYNTRRNPIYEDILPPYEHPYTCTNWVINPTIGSTLVTDTVYFEANPNYYNIFVEFLLKNPDGTFSEFDWRFINPSGCGTDFNGRFPLLKDQSRPSPLEGRLTYDMQSIGFRPLFNLRVLKLRVTIQDRALNRSNTIETPEFTLDDIK
jgi:hypothetical protein